MFSNQRLFLVAGSLLLAQGVLAAPSAVPSNKQAQPVSKQVQPTQRNLSTPASDMVPVGVGPGGRQILVKKSPDHGPVKLKLPFADNSLWMRYYQAGEDASISKHDNDLAKKYWMASLAELEKHPPAKGSDMFLSVKLSALEAGLMNLYPQDWSKETGDSDAILAKRKENVEVLSRIANINNFYAPKDDLFRTKANERYASAKQSYDKAVAEAKQSQSTPTTD